MLIRGRGRVRGVGAHDEVCRGCLKPGCWGNAAAREDPAFVLEIQEKAARDEEHQSEGEGVSVAPGEFRHVGGFGGVEVHAVDAGDPTERHEDGRDDGEHFHDFVEAVGHAGEEDVLQVAADFAVVFQNLDELNEVVEAVAQVDACFVGDYRERIADERADRVACRPDGAPDVEQFALDIVDVVRGAGGRAEDCFIFERVEVFADVFEHWEVCVNDGVNE